MKLTPSSIARRKTRRASSGSAGSPQMPLPVMRIAPKPRRWIGNSFPRLKVPLAAALAESFAVVMSPFVFLLAVLVHRTPATRKPSWEARLGHDISQRFDLERRFEPIYRAAMDTPA